MILFVSKKKSALKDITIALLVFFVMSSLTGSTEPVLCIDQDETHILGKEYFPLIECHSSKEIHPENTLHETTLSASDDHHGNSCVDIALKSLESSAFRYKLEKTIPIATVSNVLISGYPLWVTSSSYDTTLPPFYKHPHTLQLASLRTVVILI